MGNILSYRIPTNRAEALQTLKDLHDEFDGGFHPDDVGREIVGNDGMVFKEEGEAHHFDEVMNALWGILGDEIYELVMNLIDPHWMDD